MIVGYARTSTLEQKAGFEAQIAQLTEAGAEKVFQEQVSSVAERNQLEQAIEYVRENDILAVTTLSRLARSVTHLWQIINELERKKVGLRVLDMGIDTTTPTGRLMLTLIGGIVQWEREIMLERQREGIAKAHAAGKYQGSAPSVRRQAEEILRLKKQGMNPAMIAKQLKIARSSVYRIFQERAQAL